MNRRKWMVIITVIAAITVGGATYWWFDPSSTMLFPRCPVKSLTGWDCPGCGAQRCLHALLHGRWSDAWHYNPLLMVMIPVMAVMIVSETFRDRWPRFNRVMTSRPLIVTLLIIFGAWMVIRNLTA